MDTAKQTRERDYTAHQQHLARRAGAARNVTRYTRKTKHKGRDDG